VALAAEVSDLKQGTEAIEERARYELGMIREGEVFFQITEKHRGQSPVSPDLDPR
jgi:cell division protein FtsB